MEVDKANADNAAALRTAQRKNSQEVEEQQAQAELGRTARERQRAVAGEREKTDRELVEISKAANNQLDVTKKLNSDRVHALDDSQQKHYLDLASKTADDLKRLDKQALDTIENHKSGTMEKIKSVTDRGEDPFYRLKGLQPTLATNESSYTVSVALPEHEAQNLFISGEGPYIKLSLARRFQDHAKGEEAGRQTATNNYQTVVEQIAMPGAYDAKKISRAYENGVVKITIPKLAFGPGAEKIKA